MGEEKSENMFLVPKNWLEVEELKEGAAVNLMAAKCPACKAVFFPPFETCIRCGSTPCSRIASATGTVYSYTIVHRAGPEFSVPYLAAYVLLDEGPLVFGQIVNGEGIAVGDRVRAVVGRLKDEEEGSWKWTYLFSPELPSAPGKGE